MSFYFAICFDIVQVEARFDNVTVLSILQLYWHNSQLADQRSCLTHDSNISFWVYLAQINQVSAPVSIQILVGFSQRFYTEESSNLPSRGGSNDALVTQPVQGPAQADAENPEG